GARRLGRVVRPGDRLACRACGVRPRTGGDTPAGPERTGIRAGRLRPAADQQRDLELPPRAAAAADHAGRPPPVRGRMVASAAPAAAGGLGLLRPGAAGALCPD